MVSGTLRHIGNDAFHAETNSSDIKGVGGPRISFAHFGGTGVSCSDAVFPVRERDTERETVAELRANLTDRDAATTMLRRCALSRSEERGVRDPTVRHSLFRRSGAEAQPRNYISSPLRRTLGRQGCNPDHQVHPFMIMSMNSATIMSRFCSVTSDSMMTLPNSRLVPMNFTTMTPMSAKDIRGIVRTHPS